MPVVAASSQAALTDELFHALSQPLTGLHCAWEVAALRPRTVEEYRLICEQSLEQLERVEWLVAGIRELSHVAAVGERNTVVSLGDVLRQQIEDLQLLADSRQIQIFLRMSEDGRLVPGGIQRAIPVLLIALFEVADYSSEITIEVPYAKSQAQLRINSSLSQPFAELTLRHRLNFAIAQAILQSINGGYDLEQHGNALTIQIYSPFAA